MKKLIASLMVIGAMFGLSGCGGNTAPAPVVAADGLPVWVDDVESVGGIAAVGEASVTPAGWGMAKTEATANARDAIARQLNVKVKNLISNFTQTTGVGDSATVDKVFKSVSKQVAKVDLSGSKVAKVYRDRKNKTMYVLVKLDPASATKVTKTLKDAAVSSFKKDEALYQQFQAKKGAEALDSGINKSFK